MSEWPESPGEPGEQPPDHAAIAESLYGLITLLLPNRPRDVSLTTLATLATLDRSGPQRLTDLAAIEGVAQPSMTVLVTGLERAGLVRRCASPDDGRVVLVALTPAGISYLRDRRRAGTTAVADLAGELSPEDLSALTAAVPAIRRLSDLYAARTAAATHSKGVPR